MVYPFIILEDNTEIVHLESYIENGVEKVRVEIEKPVEGGFYSAECILPEYTWQNTKGFSEKDIVTLQDIIASLTHNYTEQSASDALYQELAKGVQSMKNGEVLTLEEVWEKINKAIVYGQ